ncbi:MFS transporter [Sphingomonas sp. SRS2]|uniref:MFS transporter n=1 Tax=Sphingomonas sp. SRS2 TaxID=133190 RepID=UPI00061849DF|nr:MFS transporter [Sphingomonas sp. SRS2]KKC27661.1 hypothetical protein WP12_01980 [Sphingomonas sp. SRS2]
MSGQHDRTSGAGDAAPSSPAADPKSVNRVSILVTALCWFALCAEGYDIGALGAVMPALVDDSDWRLGAAALGAIASATLVGMFFGAYVFGVVADRHGRKFTLITGFTLFTVASGLAAIAPTPFLFTVCRVLAGLGVGGIVPVVSALSTEYSPPGKVNRRFTLMYSGYPLGILLSALASYFWLESAGWRGIIALGILPIVMLPVFIRWLPESMLFLLSKGREAEARSIAAKLDLPLPKWEEASSEASVSPGVRALFQSGFARATIGFWLATLSGMLMIYGLTTWLPQIMRSAGYELGSSILFLGAFALGSATGGIMLGSLADRFGQVRVIICAFCGAGLTILALSTPWPQALTYCIVALTGVGASAAVVVTGYLSAYFSPTLRATAVGCALSFSRVGAVSGPLLAGLIAEYGLDVKWNFYLFATTATLAGLFMLLVPARASSRIGRNAHPDVMEAL